MTITLTITSVKVFGGVVAVIITAIMAIKKRLGKKPKNLKIARNHVAENVGF